MNINTEKNLSPIGVFDSGVGGLTVAREIMRQLPNESIVYFGDTARVPYGSKSKGTIIKYSKQIVRFLLTKNVKAIVIACNTASALALDELQKEFDLPIIGVVKPGAKTAVSNTTTKRIGVIGTEGTVHSQIYTKVIHEYDPEAVVISKPCPLFVPLVENGFIHKDDQIVRLTIKHYLTELVENDIDTLILGCTHYPLLADAISSVIGNSIELIDSGYETALYTKKVLGENNLLNNSTEQGASSFFVSDTPEGFESVAELFLGKNMEHTVTQIDIEKY